MTNGAGANQLSVPVGIAGDMAALANRLAAALRRLHATAFVWEEGTSPFHEGFQPRGKEE
jgi:hypothetical protein